MDRDAVQRARWERMDKQQILDVTYDDVDVIAAYQKRYFWSVRDEVFKDRVDDVKVERLLAMPDWEFCIVLCNVIRDAEGGGVHKDVRYSELDINAAYRCKWPDADPLF